MARDDMVRAVALAAQDRMTRPLLTSPGPPPKGGGATKRSGGNV
jgi:hypothetical protein